MNTTVYSTAAWSLRDHAQRWSAVMQLALQDIRAVIRSRRLVAAKQLQRYAALIETLT